MRRYGVEERLAQKTVRKFDELTAEDFTMGIFDVTN